MPLDMAGALKEMTDKAGIGLIYKDILRQGQPHQCGKSARPGGLKNALPVFQAVKDEIGCPVLTDVHDAGQCAEAATVVDVLANPGLPVPADGPAGRRR